MVVFPCEQEERNNFVLQEIMEYVGMYAEEESHPRNLVKNEEGNLRDGEIWENINESRTKELKRVK